MFSSLPVAALFQWLNKSPRSRGNGCAEPFDEVELFLLLRCFGADCDAGENAPRAFLAGFSPRGAWSVVALGEAYRKMQGMRMPTAILTSWFSRSAYECAVPQLAPRTFLSVLPDL
ncbi:MAG: hypothetical protein ACXW3B_17355 [Telluria sp.]